MTRRADSQKAATAAGRCFSAAARSRRPRWWESRSCRPSLRGQANRMQRSAGATTSNAAVVSAAAGACAATPRNATTMCATTGVIRALSVAMASAVTSARTQPVYPGRVASPAKGGRTGKTSSARPRLAITSAARSAAGRNTGVARTRTTSAATSRPWATMSRAAAATARQTRAVFRTACPAVAQRRTAPCAQCDGAPS
jgi:hypothetical protein